MKIRTSIKTGNPASWQGLTVRSSLSFYRSGQWPKLVRYVENGTWPISNNLCENAIRPFVVGRKGWLFSDTVAGAQASANLYSLVETCKANGVEPYRYLVWLFTRLPLAATADDYSDLMSWSMPAALNL